MKMKWLAGVALASLVSAVLIPMTGALAQETGVYGAIDLGYHEPKGIDATSANNQSDGSAYDWRWAGKQSGAGFARLGYQYDPNWRLELEAGLRPGDLRAASGSLSRPVTGLCTADVLRANVFETCGRIGGKLDSFTLMGNVIYDFMPQSAINPFIGAGVGMNYVKIETVGEFAIVVPDGQSLTVDDTDTVLAYQVLAGLAFKTSDRLKMDITYRYLSGSDVSFNSTGSGALQPGAWKGRYDDQSVTLGLRYAFGAPPPPMAYDAREFVVYFPWDEYVLTPEAQAVVQQAAQYSADGRATRITVVGYTDSSGSATYNVGLSEKRAKTVSDALVGLGLPATSLAVDWKGETNLAVPTPDGTKEPLNRRSTVMINF